MEPHSEALGAFRASRAWKARPAFNNANSDVLEGLLKAIFATATSKLANEKSLLRQTMAKRGFLEVLTDFPEQGRVGFHRALHPVKGQELAVPLQLEAIRVRAGQLAQLQLLAAVGHHDDVLVHR